MQPYFIKSIKLENAIWNYTQIGECYVCLRSAKKLMDFFALDGVSINSIQRNENQPIAGQALPTGTLFNVGTILKNGAHQKKITTISIIGGDVIFKCVSIATGEVVNDTTMANAQVYVAETPVVVAPMINANKIAEIERDIITANPRALRLRGVIRNRNGQSLQEFVVQYITEWNNPHNDMWKNNNIDNKPVKDTLFADTDDIQTVQGKRRSLGDLFILFRYYYPNVALKEVAKLLYITLVDQIGTCKCATIRKRVWYYEELMDAGEVKQVNDVDEYQLTIAQWKQLLV